MTLIEMENSNSEYKLMHQAAKKARQPIRQN